MNRPRKLAELPLPVQHKLVDTKKGVPKKGVEKELKTHEGPNFASNAVRIGLRENKLPFGYEYLAPNYNSLLPPMKEFVEKKLGPVLDQAEQRKLSDSQAKWPDYPQTIQELSQKHDLVPPWHILPEPLLWKWDLYRSSTRTRSWGSEVAKEKKGP